MIPVLIILTFQLHVNIYMKIICQYFCCKLEEKNWEVIIDSGKYLHVDMKSLTLLFYEMYIIVITLYLRTFLVTFL